MARDRRSNRASRYAAPIGGVFIILCIIGLITLVNSCFKFTRNMLDNSSTKYNYERMLMPVVMFDPPPFEDPTTLRPVDLLMYSVWSAVLDKDRTIYEEDDNGSLIIPASDVDLASHKLFGPNVVLTHDSFGDYEISYTYDKSTKSYHVPATALSGFYTPRVEDIFKKGDIIQLRVGYVPPANALTIDLSGKGENQQPPDKYMIYELRKNGKNGYCLHAVRDTEDGGYPAGTEITPPLGGMMDELTDVSVPDEPDPMLNFGSSGSSSDSSYEGASSDSSSSSSGESSDGSSISGESGESGSTGEGESESASVPAPEVQG